MIIHLCYFAAKKPILTFAPKGSDTQKLIEKTNTGMCFSYAETNLKNDILRLFKAITSLFNTNYSIHDVKRLDFLKELSESKK